MTIQQTIIVGIISSVIASLVFYLLMILIKPRFIIADKICRKKVSDTETDYIIKVVNTTRSFVTNIKYSLIYCVEDDDGIKEVQTIDPLKTPLANMNKYTRKNTDYAIRLTYRVKDEDYPMNDNSFLMFTFEAYHSFSNAMRIKKKIYFKDSIKDGIYETGRSTKILTIKK